MKKVKLITMFLFAAIAVAFYSCSTGGDGVGTVDTGSADDFMSRKKDTVYKTIYKTDTFYKTHVDTIFSPVYKTDTVFKTITHTDTIYNTVTKRDTIIQTKTVYKTDTIKVITHDTVFVINGESSAFKPGFGVLSSKVSIAESETIMRQSGVNIQRVVLFYSNGYISKNADQFIKDGFQVQINFDYKPTSNPVEWCTDTAFIRKQAKAFFAYYKPYIKQIPLVAVENEWDNPLYHVGNIDDYLRELAIVVDEGHKQGFKVTDAAITGNALGRWNYSQLSSDSATWWKANYFVGVSNDYTNFCNSINYYASKIKSIPIDWINWHWYNNRACSNGLPSALNHWLKATGKSLHLTNEFGVMNEAIWSCTVTEVLGVKPAYAIAYSGVNDPNNAILLTADLLKILQ